MTVFKPVVQWKDISANYIGVYIPLKAPIETQPSPESMDRRNSTTLKARRRSVGADVEGETKKCSADVEGKKRSRRLCQHKR